MKKRKVVLSELIDHLGEDRVLEILSEQETLKEQIDHFTKPIWETYFNVNLTAVILSFVLVKASDIRSLALVCKLWHDATETKTVWREFLCKRFAKLPASLASFFDPFHAEFWPKYKNMICVKKFDVDTRKSFTELKINDWTKDCIIRVYVTNDNQRTIMCGKLQDVKCCSSEHVILGTRIRINSEECITRTEGLICLKCERLAKKGNGKLMKKIPINDSSAELIVDDCVCRPLCTTGTMTTSGYKLDGKFFALSQRGAIWFKHGTLTLPDSTRIKIDTLTESFWKTFIRGLQKS